MTLVFISYRRADEQGAVGRIHDWLARPDHLGPDGVFMDVEDIPPGEDFRARISHQLNQADVVLAIIGPKWLETVPARAADPKDYVRLELEMAFERQLPVVPLLLGRSVSMPAAERLPHSIARMATLNPVEIDPGRDFPLHMERLLRGIFRLREARDQPQPFRNRHGFAFAGITRGSFVMGATQDTDPEAVAFCERLTELDLPEMEDAGSVLPPGYVYRLPTSAEWEYACRAGNARQPRCGELHKIAWTADSGGRFADAGELPRVCLTCSAWFTNGARMTGNTPASASSGAAATTNRPPAPAPRPSSCAIQRSPLRASGSGWCWRRRWEDETLNHTS